MSSKFAQFNIGDWRTKFVSSTGNAERYMNHQKGVTLFIGMSLGEFQVSPGRRGCNYHLCRYRMCHFLGAFFAQEINFGVSFLVNSQVVIIFGVSF